jgi:GAF domain-containing protein/HAMP domain-containing protein
MNSKRLSTPKPAPVERKGSRFRPTLGFSSPRKRDRLSLSMRTRLLVLFFLSASVPLALITWLNLASFQKEVERASQQVLLSAASQTAGDIDEFIRSTANMAAAEAQHPTLAEYLRLPPKQRKGSEEEARALQALEALYSKQFLLDPYVEAFLIMSAQGEIILASDIHSVAPLLDGSKLEEADPAGYSQMISTGQPYISPVFISSDGQTRSLFAASRMLSSEKTISAIFVAQYDGRVLQALVEKTTGLAGPGSFASLYDDYLIRLADGSTPGLSYQQNIPANSTQTALLRSMGRLPAGYGNLEPLSPSLAAALNRAAAGEIYFSTDVNDSGKKLSGAASRLDEMPWLVTYVQDQDVLQFPFEMHRRSTLSWLGVFLVLGGLAAIISTRRMTRPVSRLTQVAERVAAGDLWIHAPEGRDEVGKLGSAFNSMTSELRRTLESLEQRVAERTADLAEATSEAQLRARQLETISEVIRTAASIQDLDELLNEITLLISERFGYYHVGIFLIDKASGSAVLQAANSEGGQRMLSRQHRLKVGQEGIIGCVTATGQKRIAHDVGQDAVFFNNPDLPYTRSELAIPLKAGDEVVGALDIQTMEQSAFSEDDVSLISTLADQLSLAIENVRLYSETRLALADLQMLHRQYLRDAWEEASASRQNRGYEYDYGRIRSVPAEVPEQVWAALEQAASHSPISKPGEEENGKRELIAPIKIRGQVVGMLNLEEGEQPRDWSEDDLALIQAVSDQVGLALENARLFEETRLRAEREHLVSDITTRLRASNDPQQIMETAVQELRQALRASRAHLVTPASFQQEITAGSDLPDTEEKTAGLPGSSDAPEPDMDPRMER